VEENLDAIETAVRVLTAINQREPPKRADMEALRRYAPLLADNPPDKFAIEIIHEALRRRAVARRFAIM
jgi:hypothetical protein